MHAKLTNWGASLMAFYVPDKNGKMEDVVLGFDNVDDYKNDTVYFGATVGRVANRIGGAKFTLDGKTYNLTANDGKNTLHGFPGKLKVQVTYKLISKGDAMTIKMTAKAGKQATPVNLAHHTYWNLGGHNSGDILSHKIRITGSHITPTDSELIPTGEIKPVEGTSYDFLKPRPIGSTIGELPKGYDINYCLDQDHKKEGHGEYVQSFKKPLVVLEDPKSGRRMEIGSNQIGLQFYTGGQLKNVKGKEGAVYKAFAGLALETQGYPDAVNHPNFPSQILKPGERYEHFIVFKFSNQGKDATNNTESGKNKEL
ncbi:hypothetical protein Cgig2_025443 [Carnegiea gigantea]|uniref:Aldose 1-epimerase n=1 Tax=Carnegiea gigantea TaxID=171969 RepID=A0A9Q1KQM3_9CARY|nr:hypothetical protein Cgig2_025443 [Carnegiea gigantea]